jgi:3-methyl-2-oxobutanoate hydroxymethyltransferase
VSTPGAPRPAVPTVRRFLELKAQGTPIVAVTAYDALFGRLVHEAGVDLVLVGDSLGQVVLGYPSTLPVTLDDMIRHAAAVRRGAPDAFVVVDMPFLTYQTSPDDALRSCGRVLQQTGAQAVKVEGGSPRMLETVARLTEAGIATMGHVGLTPQSVHALGGYRVQGREAGDAERLRGESAGLEEAGAFSVVLELVPTELAAEISAALTIPTIGIGAGPGCDGQVLVLPDLLGLNPGFRPRFLKRYAELWDTALGAVRHYAAEVRDGDYPDADHSFSRDA